MRISRYLSAALAFAAVSSAAVAKDAVVETHNCLAGPFTTNKNFVGCLAPVETAGDRFFDDAKTLGQLTARLNSSNRAILDKIEATLGNSKRKQFETRFNKDGFKFFELCLRAQMASGQSKDLVVARCSFDSELWTLHYLFDHHKKVWDSVK